MNIRVLLIESDPEAVLFLKDVLAEIEEGRHWKNFVQIQTIHADNWAAAAAILARDPVDVMLLDPDLSDSHDIDTFRAAQTVAAHVPVILLVDSGEDGNSVRMIREGAQDFIVKDQIDCGPLAHAMRSAIERHRLLSSARACSTTDSLTGLPNRSLFLTFADRDRKLAARLGRRLMLVLAEPKKSSGQQQRDLALVEAADHLRNIVDDTDMLARIGETRFAIALLETDLEALESKWARFHAVADAHAIRLGAAIFDPARPVSLDTLLARAAADLTPTVLAARN